MIDNERSRIGLQKLLKLARCDADALRADLADIERARSSAENSLAELQLTLKREELKSEQDPKTFADFADGARMRRHNLRTTLMTLESSYMHARERLSAAYAEIKKLEHLISMQDRARGKVQRKREQVMMDEMSAARFYKG